MSDKELMEQALEALDSYGLDVQLRAAIALRQALDQERNQTWTPEHWTDYETGIVAAERAKVVAALRRIEALEAELFRLRGWDSPSDAELDAFNVEHEHLFHDDDVWAYERAFERWLFKRNA